MELVRIAKGIWKGRVGTPETHTPVPFYVSTVGYGLLVDTFRHVDFYMGIYFRTITGISS